MIFAPPVGRSTRSIFPSHRSDAGGSIPCRVLHGAERASALRSRESRRENLIECAPCHRRPRVALLCPGLSRRAPPQPRASLRPSPRGFSTLLTYRRVLARTVACFPSCAEWDATSTANRRVVLLWRTWSRRVRKPSRPSITSLATPIRRAIEGPGAPLWTSCKSARATTAPSSSPMSLWRSSWRRSPAPRSSPLPIDGGSVSAGTCAHGHQIPFSRLQDPHRYRGGTVSASPSPSNSRVPAPTSASARASSSISNRSPRPFTTSAAAPSRCPWTYARKSR